MDNIILSADAIIEASASGDKVPTFSVKAYTGGPLQTSKYPRGIIIDLAGMTVQSTIAANLHHDPTKIVGHATIVENNGKTVEILGAVSGTGEAAGEFLGNDKNGFPWKASVEVVPFQIEEIKAGQRVQVNGQTFIGPQMIARKSELFGLGFVSRGADRSNETVKIAAMAAGQSSLKEMSMELQAYIEAQGFDPATLTDKQRAFLTAQHAAEIKAAKGGEVILASEFDVDEIKAAYSEHSANLELAFSEGEEKGVPANKLATIKAAAVKAANDLKKKAIKEKWTGTHFECEAIKAAAVVQVELARAERPSGPAIHSSNRDLSGEVIEAAMCKSIGVLKETDFKENVLESAHKQFRNGLGLQQVIIMAAAANVMSIGVGERIHNGNIREALKYAFADIHAASTFSLSGILSNVANKQLLQGYMEEDQVWREISQVKTVADFKQNTSYRMLDNMEYEEIGANGEIKHGVISEESYTSQAKTYAKMFSLNRTQIINDDLGAFDELRSRVGRGAARKFNRVFWLAFLDNSTFFTSARTNYIEGSTTNLGTDGVGLGLGAKAFMERKTPKVGTEATSQVMLGGEATKLLVPSALKQNAEILYRNTNLGTVKASDANLYAGKYRPITAVQLGDSSYTNYSTTAWYLFGDAYMPMCVSFLNGQQTPTVEVSEADFNQLGIQMRGYHDFGCDKSEYLAGIKSKGAA